MTTSWAVGRLGGWGPGKSLGGASSSHRANQIQIRLSGGGLSTGRTPPACRRPSRKARPRGEGGRPSGLCARATPLQPFPVFSWRLRSCGPSAGARGECPRAGLRVGPLRGRLGFRQARRLESPLIFTVALCGDPSSRQRSPGLGSPGWGWGPSLPQGALGGGDIPPVCQPPRVGAGPAGSASPSLLPDAAPSPYPRL